MYETEIYLDGLRKKLYPTLYTVFFLCLVIFSLSCGGGYFIMSKLSCGAVFSVSANGISLSSLILHRTPTFLLVAFLTVSAFTHFTKGAVIASALFKGLTSGVFIYAMSSGSVIDAGVHSGSGYIFMFLECSIIFVFSAFCIIYSEAECVLRASGERAYVSAVSNELLCCASVFGGASLLASAASELIMII